MKVLRVLILFILIIIVLIVVLLLQSKQSVITEYKMPTYIEHGIDGTKVYPNLVTSRMYYTIDSCCEKIIDYARDNKSGIIYSLLNEEYKISNSITPDNVFNITELNKIKKYKALKMYIASSELYTRYFINGITDINDIFININIDVNNSTFDFQILNQEQFEKYISNELIIYKKVISQNSYNSIVSIKPTEFAIANYYFKDYIKSAIDFPEVAFNNLDKDYSMTKYGSLESYKKYIESNNELKYLYIYNCMNLPENIDTSKAVGLTEYNKKKYDGYTEYTCKDSYGNVYVFKATTVMQYTLTVTEKE